MATQDPSAAPVARLTLQVHDLDAALAFYGPDTPARRDATGARLCVDGHEIRLLTTDSTPATL